MEGRILSCSSLFSVNRSGCQELESSGRNGKRRWFSHLLWCSNPLQLPWTCHLSFQAVHTALCSKAEARVEQNLDFSDFQEEDRFAGNVKA